MSDANNPWYVSIYSYDGTTELASSQGFSSSESLNYIKCLESQGEMIVTIGVNDGVGSVDVYTLQFSTPTKDGKDPIGLAEDSNSSTATVPIDGTIVSTSRVTWYIAFVDGSSGGDESGETTDPEPEPEPETPIDPAGDKQFSIKLYRNTAEANVVDKTPYLETVIYTAGAFRSPANILAPIIDWYYDGVPDVNYAYIEKLGRYYYISDIVSVRNNLWTLYLNVDVLMTYKTDILNCSAVISRNQFKCSPLVVDPLRELTLDYDITQRIIPNNVFVNDASVGSIYGCYVINAMGGSTS